MKRCLLGVLAIVASVAVVPSADALAPSEPSAASGLATSVAGPAMEMFGEACNLISTDVSTPFGTAATNSCGGVRPGAALSSAGGGCTFNFIYRDAAADAITGADTYIGTAGHCIMSNSAESPRERLTFSKPMVYASVNGARTYIGDFVYARLDTGYDFALIRLNPAGRAASNPQMCHFGGPTGLRTGLIQSGELMQHYGNGMVIGSLVPARSHLALFSSLRAITTAGYAAFGDSGSGMTDAAGRASGVLVSVILTGYGSPVINSARVDYNLARAAEVIGRNLAVVTAPLL